MDANELHDRLLANKPDGVEHDPTTCAVCVLKGSSDSGGTNANQGGAAVSEPKTFNEAELKVAVDEAVAAATASLSTELERFRADAGTAEIETQLAEAKAPLETKVSELQAELDVKVAELTAAADELAALKTFLDDEAAKATVAAEVAARVDARKTEMAAVIAYDEEFVKANAERWAAMDDDAFAKHLEEIKAAVTAKPGSPVIPAATALTASREGVGSTNGTVAAGLAAVRELREAGHDPRTL